MSFSSAVTTSAAMMPMPPPLASAGLCYGLFTPPSASAGLCYGLFMALGAMFTITLMVILYIFLCLRQAPWNMGASPSLPQPPAAQAHVEEPAWDQDRGLRLGLGLPQIPTHAHAETTSGADTGLPAHAIDAIPKFLYDPQNMGINVYKAKGKGKGKGKGGEMMDEEEDADDGCCCCPICLGEYGVRVDVVRVMAQCGHMFHAQCLDEWLRRHPTCPVCRVSPLPTPLSQRTPLALAHSLSRPR